MSAIADPEMPPKSSVASNCQSHDWTSPFDRPRGLPAVVEQMADEPNVAQTRGFAVFELGVAIAREVYTAFAEAGPRPAHPWEPVPQDGAVAFDQVSAMFSAAGRSDLGRARMAPLSKTPPVPLAVPRR